MEFHEVANIFPMMNDEEFTALVADIKAHGQLTPVWTYQDKIIDGRNRYKACLELGIEPQYREYTGDESGLLSFVLSLNLQRRHLTSSQKAMLAVTVEEYLAKEAEKRMLAGKKADPVQKVVQGKSAEQAAQLMGTNRQYVLDAKRIEKKAPDIATAVRHGTLSIGDAKLLAAFPEEKRQAVLEKIDGVDPVIFPNKVKRAIEVVQKEAEIEEYRKKQAEHEARLKAIAAERATPEYQARVKKEQEEQLRRNNQQWEELALREAAFEQEVKDVLNALDRAQERVQLYEAARQFNSLLRQTACAYMIFLMRFEDLAGELASLRTLVDHRRVSRAWCNNEIHHYAYLVDGIFQRSEYDGSKGRLEGMLERCENKFRLGFTIKGVSGHSMPPIDIEALTQWIDDPSAGENSA